MATCAAVQHVVYPLLETGGLHLGSGSRLVEPGIDPHLRKCSLYVSKSQLVQRLQIILQAMHFLCHIVAQALVVGDVEGGAVREQL